jgi:hypothetical protein
MGLAWTADDAGRTALPEPDKWPVREWTAGPRHRRPTLLARSGQAVADRITALAGTDLPAAQRAAAHQAQPAHSLRRPALPERRYWA